MTSNVIACVSWHGLSNHSFRILNNYMIEKNIFKHHTNYNNY